MKNAKIILATIGVVAAVGSLTAVSAKASPQPSLLEEKAEKAKFKGKIEAVNAEAKTFTVDGAAILVTDTTKLKKEDKEITLADLKVGDQVHGKTRQNADGKTEAVSVQVGGGEKK